MEKQKKRVIQKKVTQGSLLKNEQYVADLNTSNFVLFPKTLAIVVSIFGNIFGKVNFPNQEF